MGSINNTGGQKMDIPRRLHKRLPTLLKEADTSMLEHELFAAEAALGAYHIFYAVETNSYEDFLRIENIKHEDWNRLTRNEQLSTAALGCSYTWTLKQRIYSGARTWVERLISHQKGKLLSGVSMNQMIGLFEYSIEMLLRPKNEEGLIALLIQLEERYQEYAAGERFNRKACDEGLQLLNKLFSDSPVTKTAEIEETPLMVERLQRLRRGANSIYAYLMEGRDYAQEILKEFPDPATLPHEKAVDILLFLIEEGRTDIDIKSKDEACALEHLREHWFDTDDNSPCRKLYLWFRKATSVPYFRFPERNKESRALLNEIYLLQLKSLSSI